MNRAALYKSSGVRRLVQQKSQRLILLCACLMGCILVFMPILWGGHHYAIIDDAWLSQIATGEMTGTPEGHLIFIKYPLSGWIALLAHVFPQYDVYALTLIFIQGFAWILIFAQGLLTLTEKIHDVQIRHFGTIAWSVSLIVIGCWWMTFLSFTHVCVLSVMASWMCIFRLTHRCSDGSRYIHKSRYPKLNVLWTGTLATIFWGFAFMLRYAIALFLTPFFLWIIVENVRFQAKKRRCFRFRLNPRWIYLVLAMLVVSGAIWLTDDIHYRNPEWSIAHSYNAVRSELYDYYYAYMPTYEAEPDVYRSAGLDRADRDYLYWYDLAYLSHLDSKTLETVIKPSKARFDAQFSSFKQHVLSTTRFIFRQLKRRSVRPFVVVSVLLFFCGFWIIALKVRNKKRMQCGFIWFLLHFVVALEFYYTAWRLRLPDRIIYTLLLPLLMVQMITLFCASWLHMNDDPVLDEHVSFIESMEASDHGVCNLTKHKECSLVTQKRQIHGKYLKGLKRPLLTGLLIICLSMGWFVPYFVHRIHYVAHKDELRRRIEMELGQNTSPDTLYLTSTFSIHGLLPLFSFKRIERPFESKNMVMGAWPIGLPFKRAEFLHKGLDPDSGINLFISGTNRRMIVWSQEQAQTLLLQLRAHNPNQQIDLRLIHHYVDESNAYEQSHLYVYDVLHH